MNPRILPSGAVWRSAFWFEPKKSLWPGSHSPVDCPTPHRLKKVQAHNIGDVEGVRLVGSVPGRHRREEMHKWGHLKLRRLTRELARSDMGASSAGAAAGGGSKLVGDTTDILLAQCSSIGTLGPEANWFASFKESLAGGDEVRSGGLKFVWPTAEAIRTSHRGYSSGGSIPFNEATYHKQKWIRG